MNRPIPPSLPKIEFWRGRCGRWKNNQRLASDETGTQFFLISVEQPRHFTLDLFHVWTAQLNPQLTPTRWAKAAESIDIVLVNEGWIAVRSHRRFNAAFPQ